MFIGYILIISCFQKIQLLVDASVAMTNAISGGSIAYAQQSRDDSMQMTPLLDAMLNDMFPETSNIAEGIIWNKNSHSVQKIGNPAVCADESVHSYFDQYSRCVPNGFVFEFDLFYCLQLASTAQMWTPIFCHRFQPNQCYIQVAMTLMIPTKTHHRQKQFQRQRNSSLKIIQSQRFWVWIHWVSNS